MKLILALATITLLTACGGGDDGGNNTRVTTSTQQTVITGSVIDSIIPNAQVSLLAAGSLLISATADANGDYELVINTNDIPSNTTLTLQAKNPNNGLIINSAIDSSNISAGKYTDSLTTISHYTEAVIIDYSAKKDILNELPLIDYMNNYIYLDDNGIPIATEETMIDELADEIKIYFDDASATKAVADIAIASRYIDINIPLGIAAGANHTLRLPKTIMGSNITYGGNSNSYQTNVGTGNKNINIIIGSTNTTRAFSVAALTSVNALISNHMVAESSSTISRGGISIDIPDNAFFGAVALNVKQFTVDGSTTFDIGFDSKPNEPIDVSFFFAGATTPNILRLIHTNPITKEKNYLTHFDYATSTAGITATFSVESFSWFTIDFNATADINSFVNNLATETLNSDFSNSTKADKIFRIIEKDVLPILKNQKHIKLAAGGNCTEDTDNLSGSEIKDYTNCQLLAFTLNSKLLASFMVKINDKSLLDSMPNNVKKEYFKLHSKLKFALISISQIPVYFINDGIYNFPNRFDDYTSGISIATNSIADIHKGSNIAPYEEHGTFINMSAYRILLSFGEDPETVLTNMAAAISNSSAANQAILYRYAAQQMDALISWEINRAPKIISDSSAYKRIQQETKIQAKLIVLGTIENYADGATELLKTTITRPLASLGIGAVELLSTFGPDGLIWHIRDSLREAKTIVNNYISTAQNTQLYDDDVISGNNSRLSAEGWLIVNGIAGIPTTKLPKIALDRIAIYTKYKTAFYNSLGSLGSSIQTDDYADNINNTAQTIAINNNINGIINYAKDIDLFQFTLANTTKVNIYTTGSLDTFGSLYNSRISKIASDDDSGSGNNFKINRSLSAGVYYIGVYSYKNNTGNYNLNLIEEYQNTAITPDKPERRHIRVEALSDVSIRILWSKAENANYYRLYRSLSKRGEYSPVYDGSNRSFTDENLNTSTQYHYKLSACSSNDIKTCSNLSTYIIQRTLYQIATVPALPSVNFVTESSGIVSDKLRITWSASSYANYYRLYRSTSLNGSYTRVTANDDYSQTSYTDTGLSANTIYYYKVKGCSAIDSSSCSEYSAAMNEKTTLAIPSALSVSVESSSQINISWSNVSGATFYRLYRGSNQIFAGNTGNDRNFEHTELSANTAYSYTVRACVNSSFDTCSRASAAASATTNEAGSGSQTLLITNKLNDTGVVWSGVDTGSNNDTCESYPGSYPQDCHYGRDRLLTLLDGTFTYAIDGTQVPKVGSGSAGFDFTKLSSTGATLSSTADSWSCVQDNVTGLVWEVKTDLGASDTFTTDSDGTRTYTSTSATIHHKDNIYHWGGTTAIGNDRGDNAVYYDDWDVLVNGSNSENLCGFNDWRVPAIYEFESIVHRGVASNIDENYFPNNVVGGTTAENVKFYWSSSLSANKVFNSWRFNFITGNEYADDNGYGKINQGRVRLVRSGQ